MSTPDPGPQGDATALLAPRDDARIRLLQLTDCHILAGAEDRLKGMNTRESFDTVCARALADHPGLDLVLATGDLSQDASPSAYDFLAQRFDTLGLPVFWLPGNHDDPALMGARLQGGRISAAKCLLIGNWIIVLLDSTVAGETGGCLADAELDFLDASLTAHPARHALICLHHQPLPVGSEWMDRLGLAQSRRFIERVSAQPNLRGVLWGHVHQEVQRHIDGVDWMATPSTCVQFKPGSREFALDDLAPGYRRIDLLPDGRIESRVERVDFS